MELFGVGPLELLLIVVLMLVVLGPKEMIATSRKIGRFIRDMVKSPYWAEILDTSREIRDIPTKLMRDIGIEDEVKELQKMTRDQLDAINKVGQDTAAEVNDVVKSAQVNVPSTSMPTSWPIIAPPPPPSEEASLPVVEIESSIPTEADGPVEPITDVFLAAGITPPPSADAPDPALEADSPTSAQDTVSSDQPADSPAAEIETESTESDTAPAEPVSTSGSTPDLSTDQAS
jgi:sec-independent protein translocase protein TatB